MIKSLETILLKIAQLSPSNQRWILKRLTDTQRQSLRKHQGYRLLHDATQGLTFTKQKTEPLHPIPAYCQQLATKAPLYAAIVIHQNTPSWTSRFLEQFDKGDVIKTILENQVLDIKPHIQQAVLNEWEQLISFENYLEEANG